MSENPPSNSVEINEVLKEKQNPKEDVKTAQTSEAIEKKRQLPKNPVEILKLTKSGSITLPKSVRETCEEKQAFAFWKEGDTYMLFPVRDYEIPDLILAQNSKSKASHKSKDEMEGADGEKKKRRKKTRSKTKVPAGPQPELTKYFPFPLENQEKIQDAIEASFYKLTEVPPKIDEVIERIKYIALNYGTGKKTN
ncbi:MAG: hypothetical protein DRO88_12990, partial [Promethearchaeia archaeon]